MKTRVLLTPLSASLPFGPRASSRFADRQEVIGREPQARHLHADMTLDGNTKLYRDYATTELDPDSREAIRLWDACARVMNTNDFERRWVTNQFGRDGRMMRVAQRGLSRTISDSGVKITNLDRFERKRVDGKGLIKRKGSNESIRGTLVKLSTD